MLLEQDDRCQDRTARVGGGGSMSALKKPTQSEGQIRTAGWVPSWMSELGIQPNGAVTLSKEQLRSLMRPNQKLKVQVWACGMLQASGYNDETAWFSERGKQIPLTPAHIIRILHAEAKRYFTEAGIKDENGGFAALRETKMSLRAAIVALEEDGVCERRVDGKPISTIPRKERELVSGQTRLCFFARPKPSDPEQVHSEWAQLQARILEPAIGDSPVEGVILSLPPIRIPQILKLFQFQIPGKAQISTQEYHERITKSYEAARLIFTRMMEEGVKESLPMGGPESLPEGATGAVPFRNTSEIPIENTKQKSSSSVVAISTTTTISPSDPPEQHIPATTQDWDGVGRAAAEYIPVDDKWVRRLVADCQKKTPDVTPGEVAQVVHLKGRLAMKKEKPSGFLLIAVANFCEGESFRRFRERLRADSKPLEATKPAEVRCQKCGDSGYVGSSGADLAPCSCQGKERSA